MERRFGDSTAGLCTRVVGVFMSEFGAFSACGVQLSVVAVLVSGSWGGGASQQEIYTSSMFLTRFWHERPRRYLG